MRDTIVLFGFSSWSTMNSAASGVNASSTLEFLANKGFYELTRLSFLASAPGHAALMFSLSGALLAPLPVSVGSTGAN